MLDHYGLGNVLVLSVWSHNCRVVLPWSAVVRILWPCQILPFCGSVRVPQESTQVQLSIHQLTPRCRGYFPSLPFRHFVPVDRSSLPFYPWHSLALTSTACPALRPVLLPHWKFHSFLNHAVTFLTFLPSAFSENWLSLTPLLLSGKCKTIKCLLGRVSLWHFLPCSVFSLFSSLYCHLL